MPIARALGLQIIRNLIPKGLTQSAIARGVRRAGYGYRTKDMLSDIRRLSGRYLNQYYVYKLGPAGTVPRGLMVETELKRPFKYRVFGEVTYYDPMTDSYTFENRSFYTDRLLTNDQWEDEYIKMFREVYPVPEREVLGFKVKSVEHSQGRDY